MICDIALILSFDVSVSMDEAEFQHMRRGTAAALLDEDVMRSFEEGSIFVLVMEWADKQAVLVDWQEVRGREGVERLAATLAQAPRSNVGVTTGLGASMIAAQAQFDRGPPCDRQVLDIAGDGESNHGPHPQGVHEALDPALQINALATTIGAAMFFESYVIQGIGAFVEQADGFEQFGEAMKRKMKQEMFLG